MRVIHLIGGGDTGGAKTHVLNLLRELNQHIDAEIVCFMKGDFSEDAEKMNIPIHIIESGNIYTGLHRLMEIVGEKHVDLIHCHGARGNLMGMMLKKRIHAPVVTTVHSDYRLDYMGRPAARTIYGTTYKIALRKVDYYIGVSDTMTEILIDRKFPAEKIYTIYNGIDFKTPIQTSSREDFFSSIGFDVKPGDVVAGIAARLTPVKDCPTLLRAMSIAVKEAPNLKLAIAGDGEDKEKLEALAENLGIADKVCFAGWVKDINSFYNAIDMNLLTSISETFPYALTEGTRMKNPTIASNVGGVPVLIDDGKNGFIFEPQNHEELAKHLVTLAKDDKLRKKMGEAIYKKASQLFSIDKMVEVQLSIYQSILVRNARAAERKRDGIIICGAYGHGNAGDDAILESIIYSVKNADEYMPVTVLAKNTLNIKKTFRVNSIYTFNFFKMAREMKKSLLYINGGGSLIQNVTSRRSLYYYLLTLKLAKMKKNKVDMYGCGIGPVTGDFNVKRVTKILNSSVDSITLREKHSYDELKKFGVTMPTMEVTSDPALILKPTDKEQTEEFLNKNGISPMGSYACFLLRTWPGYSEKAAEIAKTADYIYEKYHLTPVFIPINFLSDNKAAEMVIEHMKAPHITVNAKTEPELLISVLSYMKIVISMRLHGLIFSSMSGVPIVGISYDPKVNSFVDYLGYGQCMNLEDASFEKLSPAIDEAVSLIPERARLKACADELAVREKGNIEAVKKLLER